MKQHTSSRYLAELERRVLIFDGAMGTSLDLFPLTAEDFGGEATNGARDYLTLTRPDVIEQIHTSFMEAGCDVLETNTFQSTRMRLDEWGLGNKTYELNFTAAQLARKVAGRCTHHAHNLAGDCCHVFRSPSTWHTRWRTGL